MGVLGGSSGLHSPRNPGVISFTISSEGAGGRVAKQFELKEGGVIRIGRSPVADFQIEHRGISQYHAEFRLLPGEAGVSFETPKPGRDCNLMISR